MDYRGIKITLMESPGGADRTAFLVDGYGEGRSAFKVLAPAGAMVFNASSAYGDCYALDPETALADAKRQIDAGLEA